MAATTAGPEFEMASTPSANDGEGRGTGILQLRHPAALTA
jgi:hypothetical protein